MTTLGNIGAIPHGGVAGSSKTPPKEDSDVRSAAHASGLGGSGASGHDETLLARAVEDVRKIVAPVARNLQFSIDKDTGQTVVKVVDATSGEEIRQIPSEEMLAIARAFKAFEKSGDEKPPVGLLLKNKA